MATSHLLTVAQSSALYEPEVFLRTLDQSKLVDRAPAEAIERVVDFLFSEAQIRLPPANVTDLGFPIRPPEHVRVVTCLTDASARTLRSRIRKQRLHESGSAVVCESFSLHDGSSRDAVRKCLQFLVRQAEHFTTDEERILIVSGPGQSGL